MANSKFKIFILSLLRRLDLNQQSLDAFTDEESMIEFSRAFTHKTWSKSFNYERYEFLGDTIINDTVAHYISVTFPHIQNVAWMTRIKHTLISKKYLAGLAHKAKFLEFIRYGDELKPILACSYEKANASLNKEYLSILEDVFEAFIGALRNIVDKQTVDGIGGVIARNMVHTFLDKKTISVNYDDIFDPKSRLKEIYDKFGSKQLVFELKNVKELNTKHIDQLNRYLNNEFGSFGIIFTRNATPKNVFKNTIDLWSGQRKCILLLDDTDLKLMCQVYEDKQRKPIDVINKKYREFIRACPS